MGINIIKRIPLNATYPKVDPAPARVASIIEFLNPRFFIIFTDNTLEKNLTKRFIDKIKPIQNSDSIPKNFLISKKPGLLGNITYKILSPIIISPKGTMVYIICGGTLKISSFNSK